MEELTREELEKVHRLGLTLSGDVLADDGVIESAQETWSINGEGGLTLSWKSARCEVIRPGSTCGAYVMMEPYAPTRNEDGLYQYSPHYSEPSALLGKRLFHNDVTMVDAAGNESVEPLYTFNYVGPAGTLVNHVNGLLPDGFSLRLGAGVDGGKTISVSFDGDSIKSAIQKIADACDQPLLYDMKSLTIGGADLPYRGDSYYDSFVVLGGTRNMGKKTASGGYAAVTRRLTLPDSYPGSRIGSGMFEKLLIFDDIYPKMELTIDSTASRMCYLLDDDGNKIPDGTGDDGKPRYKTYTKWYVTLGMEVDGEYEDYSLNKDLLIQDRPLGILFQSGPLTGREFELVAFESNVTELTDDDVNPEGYDASPGEFRICVSADGQYILPSNAEGGLYPKPGDKVTLTNIALDDAYIRKARQELLEAGRMAAALYAAADAQADSDSWTEGIDIVTGEAVRKNEGGVPSGMMMTSVTRDLITGKVSVQYGTFAKKGLLSSMADKVDAAQTTGGGTVATEAEGVGRTVSAEQWKALQQVGGNFGIRNVNKRIDGLENKADAQIRTLIGDIDEVKAQTDKQMDMWFGAYAPTTENAPAKDWLTEEEKALHLGDLFYDSRRQTSTGGSRTWRWSVLTEAVKDESGAVKTPAVYGWKDVADQYTIDALEKIADVAGDKILNGGAEKARVWRDWMEAVSTYKQLAGNHKGGTDEWETYLESFRRLGTMLNGGRSWSEEYMPTPAWLESLTTDTAIGDPDGYRKAWDDYFASLQALTGAITASKVSVLVDDELPTPPYNKGDLWLQNDGNVMYCVNSKAEGEKADPGDWADFSDSEADVRPLLAMLAELLEKYQGEDSIRIFIGSEGSGEAADGDIRYWDGKVEQRGASAWSVIGDDTLADAMNGVFKAIGNDTLTVYSKKPASAGLYDLYMQRISFHDDVTGTDIDGGTNVWMWGANGCWEAISHAMTGVMENLGNAVRMTAFGNLEDDNYIAGSGASFTQALGRIFTSAQKDGKTEAEAFIQTMVRVGKDGKLMSGIQISADAIDFSSGTYTVDAEHINFSGQKVDLTGASITMNANQIKIGTNNEDLESKLASAGIDIANETIRVTAGRLEILGADGTPYITIGMDEDTGIPYFDFKGKDESENEIHNTLSYMGWAERQGLHDIRVSFVSVVLYGTVLGSDSTLTRKGMSAGTYGAAYFESVIQRSPQTFYRYVKGYDSYGKVYVGEENHGKLYDDNKLESDYETPTGNLLGDGWVLMNVKRESRPTSYSEKDEVVRTFTDTADLVKIEGNRIVNSYALTIYDHYEWGNDKHSYTIKSEYNGDNESDSITLE